MNAVLQLLNSLPEDQKPVLVTHSSGNHAQAIALSAKIMGLKASIAMPRNAPLVKKAAVRDYGATIVDCGVSGEVFHKPKIDCVLPENIQDISFPTPLKIHVPCDTYLQEIWLLGPYPFFKLLLPSIGVGWKFLELHIIHII